MRYNTHGRPSALGLPHGRNPATSTDMEYDDDEREFLMAVDRYRTRHHRPFPTCVEILDIARGLGWRRVAPPGEPPVYGG